MNSLLVFPGRQALLQYRRCRGEPVHWGALYTLAGQNSLLQALLRAIPVSPLKPLSEAAGILATVKALAGEDEDSPLYGIAQSRRLPHKLWRLLLQLKAARLNAGQLLNSQSLTLLALGRVLAAYQQILQQAALEDEADALDRLLDYLAANGLPPGFAGFKRLQVKDILWLRPLNMRLLLGLRGHIDIYLQFALPYIGTQGMWQLVNDTASQLEQHDGLEIIWPDSEEANEDDFSKLVYSMLQGVKTRQANLCLARPSGLYGEVEYLLGQARTYMQQGVSPQDILLVFPDLNLYGQMAEDIGQRLGLPLAFRRSQPLSHMPMCQALFRLLELPHQGWMTGDLKNVISNRYLFTFFNEIIKELNLSNSVDYADILPGLLKLLDKAKYVDSYEQSLPQQLRNILSTNAFQQDLVNCIDKLYLFINQLNNENSLSSYINVILSKIIPFLLPMASNYDIKTNGMSLDTGMLLARDMQTWQELKQGLQQLAEAGLKLDARLENSTIVREYLGRRASQQGQAQGIMVLRLEDAVGLKPKVLLAGGLTHNVLPRQPEPFVLARQERMELNKMAGMPVWRGQAEEYFGQQLRLNLLLANTRQAAVFTSPQADSSGQPMRPSIWFNKLAQTLAIKDFPENSGVFGHEPDLLQAYNPAALRLAMVYNLYGAGKHKQLAQALLRQYPELMDDVAIIPWPRDNRISDTACLNQKLAKIKQLSASMLNQYIICPQRWFFNYICRLRDEESVLDLTVMDEGNLVHALLAEFFNPQSFSPLNNRQAIREKLEQIWSQLEQPQHSLILAGRKPLILERLLRVIENELSGLGEFRPLATEYSFAFQHLDLPGLRGTIDRIDLGAQQLRVTDYKYSNNISEKDFKPDEQSGQAANIQLLLYLAAMAHEHEDKELQARIVGCKTPAIYNVLSFPAHGTQWSNVLRQIEEIWHDIRQGRFQFKCDTCQHCDYRFICRFRDFTMQGESHEPA